MSHADSTNATYDTTPAVREPTAREVRAAVTSANLTAAQAAVTAVTDVPTKTALQKVLDAFKGIATAGI